MSNRVIITLDGNTSSFAIDEKSFIVEGNRKKYYNVCKDIYDPASQIGRISIIRTFKADEFHIDDCCKGSDTVNCACK